MTNVSRSITIEHNGKTYSGRIATIEGAHFGQEHHGILTASLQTKWQGGGVGVCSDYCLDTPVSADGASRRREGTAYGLDYLMQIMETVGVSSWSKLVGREVIVLFDEGCDGWGNQSKGIAGLTNDRVFIPAEHTAEWLARDEAVEVSS